MKIIPGKAIEVTMTKKWNGWVVVATFDGGAFWKRQYVFNTKRRMLKWIEKLEWYPAK